MRTREAIGRVQFQQTMTGGTKFQGGLLAQQRRAVFMMLGTGENVIAISASMAYIASHMQRISVVP